MLVLLISLISGIIFSIGLIVSGMTNPDKVLGFLDLFGAWDYSLALVMGGAVGFNLITFYFFKNKKPLFCEKQHLPLRKIIDKNLVIGSALFGIGWGLIGVCPGPGLVNLVLLNSTSIIFVVSMLFGMFICKAVRSKFL